MVCDPCQHCQNIYDDSDESVGMYGYGCTYFDGPVEDDWEEGCGRPCPGFRPVLASDYLEHQIC